MGDSGKTKSSVGNWTKLLFDSRVDRTEAPGEDWKTVRQIATEQKLSISWTSSQLRQLAREGKLQVRKFVLDTGSKTYPVPHYKIIK